MVGSHALSVERRNEQAQPPIVVVSYQVSNA